MERENSAKRRCIAGKHTTVPVTRSQIFLSPFFYSFFLFSNNRFNVYLPDDTYLVFSILPRGYEIQPIGSRIAKEEYRSSKYERTILFKIYKREIFTDERRFRSFYFALQLKESWINIVDTSREYEYY